MSHNTLRPIKEVIPIVQMMILGNITSELLFKSLKNSCFGRQVLSHF